jgi:LEA14-like dessication related protein
VRIRDKNWSEAFRLARHSGVWLVFAALAALAACSAMRLQAPKVSLADFELRGGNLVEQRFALKLRVQNPNDREIAIQGVSFDLDISGKPFAHGVGDKPVTLPRFGEGVVEVEAVSNLGSLVAQIGEIAKVGKEGLPYRVTGNVVAEGFGSVPFDSRGHWKLPRSLRSRSAAEGN